MHLAQRCIFYYLLYGSTQKRRKGSLMNIHTQTNWDGLAQTLWEEGLAFFPIDESLVEPARQGFKDFLQRRTEHGCQVDWCLQRPGEQEHDLGLIQRTGGAYDVKWFFHQDASLLNELNRHKLLTDSQDHGFLTDNRRLMHNINHVGQQLTRALDKLYNLGCSGSYAECCLSSMPYSTTTLRSLFYEGVPGQTGAQAHIDRSFLTIHLGDEGGNLQMLIDGQWQNISPPAGYAVAFFGVKALWVTHGRILPLKHRSVTIPGQDRFAFVHFGHVPLKYHRVRKASDSLVDFYSLFEVAIDASEYHWR